jgi:2-polyprenyl-3-methyl-5-hydroxy-6-metoxy-1,4-benzoquinol methylase
VAQARYNDIAGWYPTWVAEHGDGLIAEHLDDLVSSSLRDARVLDVACGHGRATRWLARLGATATGVDLSAELVAVARKHEADNRFGVEYHVADVTDVDQWWNGVPFDGAICEMSLMDIDDLDSTTTAVATVVRPGGWFLLSMVHPCFPGNESGLSSWPPDRSYFTEGRWTSTAHNPDGVRSRVGSSHRTLSTYLNTLVERGFSIDRLVEPVAPVPTYLLIRCHRPSASKLDPPRPGSPT